MNVIEEWSFILPILRCVCPGGTPCKSRVAMAKLSQMLVHLCPHSSYSPDLAPFDLFLFGHLKVTMFGLKFDSPVGLFKWAKEEFERIRPAVLEGMLKA
jgi:hypothetical protein